MNMIAKKMKYFLLLTLVFMFAFSITAFAGEFVEIKDSRTGFSVKFYDDTIAITANDCLNKQSLKDGDAKLSTIRDIMKKNNIILQTISDEYDMVVYANETSLKESDLKSININDYKQKLAAQIGDKYEIEKCEYNTLSEFKPLPFILSKIVDKTSGKKITHCYTVGGGYGYSIYLYSTGNSMFDMSDLQMITVLAGSNLGNIKKGFPFVKLLVWLVILGAIGYVAYSKREKIKPYLSKEGIAELKKQVSKENLSKGVEKIKESKDSISEKISANKKAKDNVVIDDTKVLFGSVAAPVDDKTELVSTGDETELLGSENATTVEATVNETTRVEGGESTVLEEGAAEATVSEPKVMEATVLETKGADATVLETGNLEATVLEVKDAEATVLEVKDAEATVLETKAMEATVLETRDADATVLE